MEYVDTEELIGKTVTNIDVCEDTIKISCDDGSEYMYYHDQDCCECVYIYDIKGDLHSLVGKKLILVDHEETDDLDDMEYEPYDSYTITKITFKTDKDTVISRWIGDSNGYYSERVDLAEITKPVTDQQKDA
jgi:hypothetical protein